MYLGIDIGETHTDGVLLDENMHVVSTLKVLTEDDDHLKSIGGVLAGLLGNDDPGRIARLIVSSSLARQLIVSGQGDKVGVLATGGPGLPLDLSGADYGTVLAASLDHRGEVLEGVDLDEAQEALLNMMESGARAFVVISKFGPQNIEFEQVMAEAASLFAPGFPLTRASQLSRGLNFPRRLTTAILNSSFVFTFKTLSKKLLGLVREAGLNCPVCFLEPDGGVLTLEEAMEKPILAMSGSQAAWLTGMWSQAELDGDALMIDFGGGATNISLMQGGELIMDPEGLVLGGKKTLIRSFKIRSLPLGGDSVLSRADGRMTVGPERFGPPLALNPDEAGQRPPTLIDAMNVAGLCGIGDPEVSRRAVSALGGESAEKNASEAVSAAMELLKKAADDLIREVSDQPVYTLDKMSRRPPVRPERIAVSGAPAKDLADSVSQALGLPVTVPDNYAVINAIGAALARPSLKAELYADTALRTMTIPSLNIRLTVDRSYNLRQAQQDLLTILGGLLKDKPEAGQPHIVSAESINQLAGYGRSDKIIRVRAESRPVWAVRSEAG